MQATAANQFNTAMLDLAKMSGVNANGLAYGTALAQSIYSVPNRTLI